MDIRPECELLVLLSRQDLTDAHISRINELMESETSIINWGEFALQATQHRVAPIVGWQAMRLEATSSVTGIYSPITALLAAAYRDNARRNAALGAEIVTISEAAAEAGIPVVVRKGGHLAFHVYRDPGVRPMADLDLLIERSRAQSLVGVLKLLGYQEGVALGWAHEIRPISRRERLFWHLHGSDLPKLCREVGTPECPVVSADLNISLTLPNTGLNIPLPPLIERAERVNYRHGSFMVLSAEDVLIDLCHHIYKASTVLRFMTRGAKHRRMLKYVDVAEVIRANRSNISWRDFLSRVSECHISEAVYYAMAHLDMLFPEVIPPDVLGVLRSHCEDPDTLLRRYGQWDVKELRLWRQDFISRFFDGSSDGELPESRSLV